VTFRRREELAVAADVQFVVEAVRQKSESERVITAPAIVQWGMTESANQVRIDRLVNQRIFLIVNINNKWISCYCSD
jgi:hypothetical protein